MKENVFQIEWTTIVYRRRSIIRNQKLSYHFHIRIFEYNFEIKIHLTDAKICRSIVQSPHAEKPISCVISCFQNSFSCNKINKTIIISSKFHNHNLSLHKFSLTDPSMCASNRTQLLWFFVPRKWKNKSNDKCFITCPTNSVTTSTFTIST
jgi:hypothetical protein